MKILRSILFLFFIFLFVNFSFAIITFNFTGKVVKVVDGDTIWVEYGNKDVEIRILGIDAPEIVHKWLPIKEYKFYGCGDEAKKFAEKFLLGKIVGVYKDTLSKSKDKYNRYLRYVFLKFYYKGKQIEIPYGALAIYKGMAKVYKYENFTLKPIYYKLESIAKEKKMGIWSEKCIKEDHLIKKKYLKENKKEIFKFPSYNNNYSNNSCGYTYHKKGCDIKGNINKYGKKIYHLPGRKYYNITKINPSKGERWFCSEKQALRCGRRPSFVR